MRDSLKGNLAVVLLVAAVVFGMWQWHIAEVTKAINDQMWKGLRANIRLDQTQNILSNLQFDNQDVANAFRQAGYKIQQPKPTKQDKAIVSKRHGN